MVRIVLFLLSLSFSFSALSLERVTASIDKNPVVQGESLILDVIADDSIDANALDTSALLKDFVVGRTSTSSETRMINGSTSRQTKWSTVLIPKKSGKFIIPSFNVQGKKTSPIALVVVEQSNEQAKQRDIFITSEVSNEEVYVQQQFTLTVKLHVGVALEGGSLSDPIMTDANIVKLGQDEQKEQIINGRRFQVIERKYAVSPQKSGEFSLEMPLFSGQVSMPSQRRSGLFGFNQSKPVSVISDPITIKVKPQPANFQGQWLPSELFTIHEEWQPEQSEFMVGEPITRTITITAAGIAKEQLPQVTMPANKGLKIYPDQPVLHSGINGDRLVSQSVNNFAVVATVAGKFTLPEIRIPWWNTVNNRAEFATLPARTITVKANPELNMQAQTAKPIQPELPNTAASQSNLDNRQTIIVEQASWLQWLFLALWLITSLLWALVEWRRKQNNKQEPQATDINQPYLALLAACKKNDGQQVLALLTPCLKTLYPNANITNISQALNTVNNSELTEAVNELQSSYYGKSTSTWQGKKLLSVIQHINKNRLTATHDNTFALNP
ncbi:BatD family protein [Thalassotalea agariperforans]